MIENLLIGSGGTLGFYFLGILKLLDERNIIDGIKNIIGTSKNDTIIGSKNGSHIISGEGNDTISITGGNNTVLAGLGDDVINIEAQKAMATLAVEQESLNRVKPTKDETEQEVKVESAENTETINTPSVEETPEPDPKAVAWAEKNDWFGKDIAMTSTAFAFHNQLIRDEGYDPTSDDYYSELDKRIVDAFPHKFDGNAPQKNVQDVVAVSSKGARSTKKARTVRLTPSQLSIAKRLGVSPEEYAKHVKT